MTIEQMKQNLCVRYPGSDWATKVKTMADAQVIAIYSRCANAGLVPKPEKKRVIPEIYEYRCPDCLNTFETKEPNITNCLFCNSPNFYKYNIKVKQKLERIIKETTKK